MSDDFARWWEENREALEKQSPCGGHLYSRREIARAAWVYSAMSLSKDFNDTVETMLLENIDAIRSDT